MNLQAKFHQSTVNNLLKVQSHYPHATIGGGAVRDLCLGKPAKDLDIFISGSPDKSITLKRIKDPNHWVHNPVPFWSGVLGDGWSVVIKDSSYNNNPAVDTVVTCYNMDYFLANMRCNATQRIPRIDIIFLLKPVDKFFQEDFDFGLCKAFFNGRKFKYTSDFISDVKNKEITLSGSKHINLIQYSIAVHFKRISHKYPNFTLVIPPEYQKIIDDNQFPF